MNIDENIFFKEVTLRICSSLNIRTAVRNTYEYIKKIIPVDNIYLDIHDEKLSALRFIAIEPEDDRLPIDSIITLEKDVWDATNQLNKPIINDISNEFPLFEKMRRITGGDNSSSLVVPLNIDDQKMGTLVLRSSGNNIYNRDHLELVSCVMEPFTIALSNFLAHQDLQKQKDRLADENQFLHEELTAKKHDDIIGARSGLKNVMDMVHQVAPKNNTVLLLGETGAGKEVIANSIHYSSKRQNGPFIKINCGAIPESLIDTELFGHEKGAFTGAVSMKRGRFERADGGTIFLDEIGELPMQAQVRLLRILQNHELERVGGTTSIPLNIRVIAATHRKLEDMVKTGQFREDLWFRLNVFPIFIPPLRQRKEDIPALTRYFIKQTCSEMGFHEIPPIEFGALERLTGYSWPGNVRELQNVIERELIRYKSGKLQFSSINADRQKDRELIRSQSHVFIPEDLDRHTAEYISQVLSYTKGRINGKGGAAEILGLKPSTLRSKMAKLNVTREEPSSR